MLLRFTVDEFLSEVYFIKHSVGFAIKTLKLEGPLEKLKFLFEYKADEIFNCRNTLRIKNRV